MGLCPGIMYRRISPTNLQPYFEAYAYAYTKLYWVVCDTLLFTVPDKAIAESSKSKLGVVLRWIELKLLVNLVKTAYYCHARS